MISVPNRVKFFVIGLKPSFFFPTDDNIFLITFRNLSSSRSHCFFLNVCIQTYLSQAISYAIGFRQSKTALFDWTFFRLDSSGPSSPRQSSRFYSVVFFPEAVGVREYCCIQQAKSFDSSVLRALSASNGWVDPRPSELVA